MQRTKAHYDALVHWLHASCKQTRTVARYAGSLLRPEELPIAKWQF